MATEPLVVVAEDDPNVLDLMVRTLDAGRFDVDGFETGTACWERLQRPPAPDLVVLDVTLPGIDGIELLERIRRTESLADLPVVFVSGRSPEEGGWTDAEPTAYIMKPFSPLKLREQLEELV